MAEYKNIVLLKGLENMEDYQFRTVKSLLRKELKLTKKMQEDYDRIQLADWMEDKFPKDAGLDKLIKVCEHIKDLKDLAKKLKTEKAKVQKKKQGKCKTAGKKKGQDELSSSESLFINKESYKSVPSSKKKRKAIAKTEGEKKNKLTQDQDHLPETSGTDIKTEEDCLQNSPKPPPTSPSSSSNKKKRKEITKTEGGKKKKLTQEQAQLPEPLGTDIKKDEDCLQTPPKPPPTPPSSSLNKKRKSMREEETGVKKSKAAKEPDQPPCCEEPTAMCQSPILHSSSSASSNIPSAKNQKSQPQNQNIPRGAVLHSEPLTVMVLTATDPFEYESPEHEVKNMLHATVATVSQYFHVKVFNINLKEKFTKKNFIIISNYFESKGILEINETSSVLEAAPDQMIEVPNSIIRNANASPKICDIQKGTSGAVFYGVFTLHKKTVNRKNTIYEIKDGSGSIEVVGSGKWHNINCKEGDKLHLFCFHLKTIDRQPKLVCGEHSFIKISKRGNVPKEPAKEEDHHHGPKQVMVLKVTEPFTYDLKEDKRMFHATVATETEFFRVKVFDTALKSKFIPRNIIAISDYFGCNGFLEIYRASCVSDVNVNPTMVISNTLRQRANATPKISYLFSQARGTFVSGEYLVNKKTERNKFIYYGIGDDTGKMEVVVYGRLTNVRCEPGSKLRLVCFELTSTEDGWQLRSVRHSYMQVINARK